MANGARTLIELLALIALGRSLVTLALLHPLPASSPCSDDLPTRRGLYWIYRHRRRFLPEE